MDTIHKKILLDEDNRPVAVQIEYSDWLKLEKKISIAEDGERRKSDINRFSGLLHLKEDPLEYQARIRKEWG